MVWKGLGDACENAQKVSRLEDSADVRIKR